MANCAHCNKAIGCGCQQATAGDGKHVHNGCLNIYNESLTKPKSIVATPFNPGQVVIPPTTAR